jgi:hypothetical protein
MSGSVIDAQAQANAFKDVPPNSWAYQAIAALAADGVIEGYPDGTFKGARPLTRYEAAVIVERAIEYVSKKLANPQTAPSVSPADLDKLRALLDEFRGDIDALKLKVADLDARVKKVEDTQKAQQIHVLYFLRAPGTFQEDVSGYAGNGHALPTNTALTTGPSLGGGYNVGRNSLQTGSYDHGAGYQVLRVFFDGQADANVSYHFRLEQRYYFDNASNNGSSNGTRGTSSSAPNLCSGSVGAAITTCGGDYPGNTTLRLNYANMKYEKDGFSATVGRYFEINDSLGLNFADYFNGVELGYAKNGVTAKAGYGFQSAAGSDAGYSSQFLFGTLGYAVTKKINIQGTYATDINPTTTLWNPSAPITGSPYGGLYETANHSITTGSLYGDYTPTKNLTFAIEGEHRFGKDPYTGANWQQNNAVWAQVQAGAFKANPYHSYVEGGFIQSGFNSLSGHTNIIGTTNYEQFYIANPLGYRVEYGGAHYWVSKNARVGLDLVHFDLIPGTDIPASTATCPGCYISHDSGTGIFLQSLFQI